MSVWAVKVDEEQSIVTTQVVEMSVAVNNNSPIQDYVHPDDQIQPTFEMTPALSQLHFWYTNFFPPVFSMFLSLKANLILYAK